MIILKQYRICRKDLRANPNVLYLFGDNLDRTGYGGQAAEMRGEPNAYGVATKRRAGHDYPGDFFFDAQPDVAGIIDSDFDDLLQRIKQRGTQILIVPLEGIGTGLARLQFNAPELLERIEKWLTILGELE